MCGSCQMPDITALALLLQAVLLLIALCPSFASVSPPKVIYDNDGVWESSGTADFFYYVLASQGAIDLRGVITTCTTRHREDLQWEWPFPPLADEDLVSERQAFIEKCRRSGLRNIPDCTAGVSIPLDTRRPPSGVIEDTEPIENPGSRLIVAEARKCSPANPLYICMGGEATALACAYLMDPSIAGNVVAVQSGGPQAGPEGHDIDGRGHNFAIDGWAAYVCVERLQYHLMTLHGWSSGDNTVGNRDGCPLIERDQLWKLPDTEIRQALIEKWWALRRTDWDSRPAIFVLRPDYPKRECLTKFDHWQRWDEWYPNISKDALYYKEAEDGYLHNIFECNADVATSEWWARATDPSAWHETARQTPYGGAPHAIPGRVEFEHFDYGGEGYAYHGTDVNACVVRPNGWPNVYCNPRDPVWLNVNCGAQKDAFRLMENVDLVRDTTASSGYSVGRVRAGEWIEYTVHVAESAAYDVTVAVACKGSGAQFHLEFDGEDKTGQLSVPDTGAWDDYHRLTKTGVRLRAGRQVMRICFDAVASSGWGGVYDHVEFAPHL